MAVPEQRETILQKILADLSHLDLTGSVSRDRDNGAKACGGSVDVFHGWSILHNKPVAIRRVRVVLKDDFQFAKVFIDIGNRTFFLRELTP